MSATVHQNLPPTPLVALCPELPGVQGPRGAPPGAVSPRAAFQDLLLGRAVLVDATASGALPAARLRELRTMPESQLVHVLGRDDEHGQQVADSVRQAVGGLTVSAVRGGHPGWLEHGMPDLPRRVDAAAILD